jgi:anti-sigma regulatory factor (Ser/Thr protein kinase)
MEPPRGSPDVLELALTVSPDMVTAVRRFVGVIVQRLGADQELSGRVSLTAHELFENVAKYGADKRGILRMQWSDGSSEPKLTLTVTNSASPAHLERLKRVFEEMDASGDPVAHYFMLMQREVATDESGIGLARIRAEADMRLLLTIDRNDVCISATTTLLQHH